MVNNWICVRESNDSLVSEVSWIHVSKIDRIFYCEGDEYKVMLESGGGIYLLNVLETQKEADIYVKEFLKTLQKV